MFFKFNSSWKSSLFNFGFNVPLIKKSFQLVLSLDSTPEKYVMGYGSKCLDGKHVLFFDYEGLSYSALCQEVRALQDFFKLAPAYVFENDIPDSYHVVILTKFPIVKAFEVLKNSSCDAAFINSVKNFHSREWCLRIAAKGKRKPPVFKEVLYSDFREKEISSAHKKFLETYFSVPEVFYLREDKLSTIPVISYNTASRC